MGIAKVVIRNKQHLAALRPYEGVLLLETMYYADEVRSRSRWTAISARRACRRPRSRWRSRSSRTSATPFKPDKYDDEYRKELLALIRAKAKGKPLPEPAQEEEAEVVDLMAALRESVEQTKKQRKRAARSAKLPRPWRRSSPTTSASATRRRRPSRSARRGAAKEPIFVVQRHDARRLHYDFRLERNGALASWAVPKGVPLEPGQQHLAVHVEDHPLDYATFEGEIPKGEYGAGTVEIWDNGTYELLEEKKDGGLTVRLHGERLEGTWALVPAHLDGDEKNWLILRKRDDSAPEPREAGAAYPPMLATLPTTSRRATAGSTRSSGTATAIVATSPAASATLRRRNGNDLTSALPRRRERARRRR